MRRVAGRWWFEPVPLARVAWLRLVAYAFVWVDVLFTTPWVTGHGDLAPSLYQPLLVGRLLELPTPSHAFVHAIRIALLAAALVAASGRLPRLAGTAVAVLYLEWMVIAFSYGKVDHDRFAFLVTLAVLPTVGRAGLRERRASDGAGWAIRCIQVAAVATYFLSTWAKFRYGGFGWVNSAVLLTAIVRKGNPITHPLIGHPLLLVAGQWGIVAFELTSVLVLFTRRARLRYAWVGTCFAFHIMTMITISIVFLPQWVALLAFLPLERLWTRPLTRRSTAPFPVTSSV